MYTQHAVGDFGTLLRRHRIRVRLTQQQLADFSTLSVRAIRDLERGRAQRPRPDTVRLLADVLRLDGPHRADFELAGRGGPEPTAADRVDATRLHPPVPVTPIIGRDAEVSALTELLTVDGQRLAAVVGVTGVGKTRLLIEVARVVREEAGWQVLWLSAAETATFSAATVAALAELVGDRHALVVVDGQATAGPPGAVLELLQHCPRLRAVTTALAPGGIPAEQVFPLAPLEVPAPEAEADPAALARVGSVRLLTLQLRRYRPGFRLHADNAAVVAGLCRSLDGIPRALALVASWSLVHPPEQLLDAVTRNPFALSALPASGAGVDAGLRDSLRRSLDAVEPALQPQLTRLAGLRGSWSIPEAARLTGSHVAELAGAVHALMVQGLVRQRAERAAGYFSVLNLVRKMHAEPRWPEVARTAAVPSGRSGEVLVR
ncbi:helix-turn-helix protein [Krasilnikovia cinnamomea]|uniref:Helix-turn-helix protein n=1 Tax=Krasilnikovia cinnamomea TaxID=349313 RepID=A0A4Q7ZS61_9ACTN|nr:helix-turn-helix domain-containing protein [Krasilnikovia cinnamomea]RZU53345.1 helix-turn-helix protein [Krasilnikovia cinnamomea]